MGYSHKLPTLTFGVRFLIIMLSIGATIVALFSLYAECKADGERIFIEGEVYRLFTSVFAVGSLVEFGIMLLCFVWMLFQVSEYEKQHSTVYTIWHFWLVNLMIAFNVASLFMFFFNLTTMMNFDMDMCGIYPYCLYMHLKTCLNRPSETVNYWFLPIPLTRWTSGLFLCIFSLWFSTESQGCLFILLHFIAKSILNKIVKCCKKLECLAKEGPMFPCIFVRVQKMLSGCCRQSQGFISIESLKRDKEENEKKYDIEMQEQIK